MTNPNDPQLVDTGICKKKSINGENFYLYISDTAVVPTVPRENDPTMSETRRTLEALAHEITVARGGEDNYSE